MIPTRKHLQYALGYLGLNLRTEAQAELARIRPEDKALPEVLEVRVELAMAEEAWDRVIALAPQITDVRPAVERPWIAWAYALRELQQIDAAREVLLRGEQVIAAPTVLVDYNLACYFCLLGDLVEANRRLKRVFTREPGWKVDARTDPDLAALRAGKR